MECRDSRAAHAGARRADDRARAGTSASMASMASMARDRARGGDAWGGWRRWMDDVLGG